MTRQFVCVVPHLGAARETIVTAGEVFDATDLVAAANRAYFHAVGEDGPSLDALIAAVDALAPPAEPEPEWPAVPAGARLRALRHLVVQLPPTGTRDAAAEVVVQPGEIVEGEGAAVVATGDTSLYAIIDA